MVNLCQGPWALIQHLSKQGCLATAVTEEIVYLQSGCAYMHLQNPSRLVGTSRRFGTSWDIGL
jgi:hypothetical protein